MLTANRLDCSRGRRRVLRSINLTLPAGEVLGVLGSNGAGKTTLLATLAGELVPAAGLLQLDDREVRQFRPRELARRRAVLPQSAAIAFDLDVHTIVGMGGYPFPELPPADLESLVNKALTLADAHALAGRAFSTLSGGEQQRVQFARVLVQLLAARPPDEYRILLLDEPTASLDPKHQVALLGAVRALVREQRVAALVVLHDVNLAAAWCDRVLLLADGGEVALDTPLKALTEKNLQSVYDMSATVLEHPTRAGVPLVLFG